MLKSGFLQDQPYYTNAYKYFKLKRHKIKLLLLALYENFQNSIPKIFQEENILLL